MEISLAVRDRWIFHGERGTTSMHRNQFTTDPVDLVGNAPDSSIIDIWTGPGIVARPHLQNWLDCIKTRGEPIAPVEIGHRSVTICHLANIVRDLGRKLHWDLASEVFVGDAEANALLSRPRRRGFELPLKFGHDRLARQARLQYPAQGALGSLTRCRSWTGGDHQAA